MRLLAYLFMGAVSVMSLTGCRGSCPTPDVQDREPNAWEAQLERRVELRLNPSSTITIKRDVHNIEIDVEAGRFADAFHQVLRDPNRRFGLIRVDRERRNRDKPFHIGERFQGRYELDEAIRQNFRGWGRTFFGNLVNIPEVKEWLCRIENEATSDYGVIARLEMSPPAGEPYVLEYHYLDGSPIAGSSTFIVAPLGPSRCRLTQVFEYQELTLTFATFFSAGGLKLHDQVVMSQATQAAALVGGHVLTSDIPPEYATP